jgi:hypothetical protein
MTICVTGEPLWALLDGGLSDLLLVVVKVLAVLVGAVAGWFVGGWVTRLLVRLAFHKTIPPYPLLLARLASAVLVGWLVYLYLDHLGFGTGGGSGGGKGAGVGPGKDGKGKDSGSVRPGQRDKDQAVRDRRASKAEKEEVSPVRMLGGSDVKEGRFYLVKIKGKDTPMNRDEVTPYLEGYRHDLKKKPLRILIYRNSVHEAHASIKYLETLARDNGWQEPIKVVSNEEAPPPRP